MLQPDDAPPLVRYLVAMLFRRCVNDDRLAMKVATNTVASVAVTLAFRHIVRDRASRLVLGHALVAGSVVLLLTRRTGTPPSTPCRRP